MISNYISSTYKNIDRGGCQSPTEVLSRQTYMVMYEWILGSRKFLRTSARCTCTSSTDQPSTRLNRPIVHPSTPSNACSWFQAPSSFYKLKYQSQADDNYCMLKLRVSIQLVKPTILGSFGQGPYGSLKICSSISIKPASSAQFFKCGPGLAICPTISAALTPSEMLRLNASDSL